MSVDQHERLKHVVKNALHDACMGEPFGYAVEFTFAPKVEPNGQVSGLVPAWFILVTIRAATLGEPDVGNGAAVGGVLPPDSLFRDTAVALLEGCRKERDQVITQTMKQVGMDLSKAMREGA